MNKKLNGASLFLIGAGIIGGGITHSYQKLTTNCCCWQGKKYPKEWKKGSERQRQSNKASTVNRRIHYYRRTSAGWRSWFVFWDFRESNRDQLRRRNSRKKGQLLAKVNDRQLQAQLQRLVSQLKLAEDRVFRQDALLKRDAVSKEAYEQVKTDLATLNADIEIVKAEHCPNRAPCSIWRNHRTSANQCRFIRFADNYRCQTDKDYSAESRIFSTGTLCKPD